MRSLITVADLSVSVALTMGFTAESFRGPSARSSETIRPLVNNENGLDGHGLTVEQENAIPLQLASTVGLPDEFDLTFDTGRTLRRCHIVWQSPSNVGVFFDQSMAI